MRTEMQRSIDRLSAILYRATQKGTIVEPDTAYVQEGITRLHGEAPDLLFVTYRGRRTFDVRYTLPSSHGTEFHHTVQV